MNFHEDETTRPFGNLSLEKNPRQFYMYDLSRRNRYGQVIVRNSNIEVCSKETIYEVKNRNGVLKINTTPGELEHYVAAFTDYVYVPETPTCWPLKKRIAAHMTVLKSALKEFSKGK